MTFIFLSRLSINDVKKNHYSRCILCYPHISIIIYMYIISSDTNYTYENSDGILQKNNVWPKIDPGKEFKFCSWKVNIKLFFHFSLPVI